MVRKNNPLYSEVFDEIMHQVETSRYPWLAKKIFINLTFLPNIHFSDATQKISSENISENHSSSSNKYSLNYGLINAYDEHCDRHEIKNIYYDIKDYIDKSTKKYFKSIPKYFFNFCQKYPPIAEILKNKEYYLNEKYQNMLDDIKAPHFDSMKKILENISNEDLPVLYTYYFNRLEISKKTIAAALDKTPEEINCSTKNIKIIFDKFFKPKDISDCVCFYDDFKKIPEIAENLIREEDKNEVLFLNTFLHNQYYNNYNELPIGVKMAIDAMNNKINLDNNI